MLKAELAAIKELQATCEKYEPIKLKLNWDMLETRNDLEKNDFFYYEEQELIGYLALYPFGNKVEVCGMVHPSHRRKGLFSALFQQAKQVIEEQGFTSILLNTPAASKAGMEWTIAVGGKLKMSEHQMKWDRVTKTDLAPVILRKSTLDDYKWEADLDVLCFGMTREDAESFTNRKHAENLENFFIIEDEKQAVGKVRVQELDGEAWIYGFAVHPNFQGKGIGRRTLSQLINIYSQKDLDICLDVEVENLHALGLYESCGFRVTQGQDYYDYNI
ncbi:GNAT family N-acetyltransferase [Mangrovibacillus cuniculi]|uniref:GNAT family N-acetyltransferase n=1 Tax=Mangrovibacillus cuniculi TaxID=2593652 RepID=A0A7S8CDS7_9BACI|nr:GNAT family N-acetyltransferase [Mangrovibacillus cuniculi]QPC48120.1 GNAT family N-acetyltransferase [Mangrovibacillus cuniculi]